MSIQHPDRRVRRTKESFKAALLSLMEEKNFHTITITEIVNMANYNRGTFYSHYEQKEDLLDEIIGEMFEKLNEAYRKPYRGLSVVEFNNLPSKSIVLFHHFLENKKFYKLMLHPETAYNFREKMTNKLAELFREDYTYSTEVNPNIDIDLFSTYRIHGIIGLIIEWIDNDFEQSPAYMGDQLIQILNFHTPKFYLKDR